MTTAAELRTTAKGAGTASHLALFSLATMVVGCSQSDRDTPPSTPAPPAQVDSLVSGIEPSPRAALFTIYYHALRRRNALPSPERERYPAGDVEDAAKRLAALAKDNFPQSKSWQRRAIAVLVGSSVPAPTPEQWTPESFRKALLTLHAPLTPIYDHWVHLQDQLHRGAECDTPDEPMALEETAWNVLNSSSDLPPACCACLRQYGIDGGGSVAMAYFELDVQRAPADVSIGMDPRCWARCEPSFFSDTHTVNDCSGTNNSPVGPAPICGKQELDPATAVVLENVDYATLPGGCNPPDIQFQNLLKVGGKPQPDGGYTLQYALCLGLQSAICGAAGGLSVDCGCTGASDDATGATNIWGIKYLRFCDPDLDDWTVVGLRAMVDEIREQGVCCGMTHPGKPCDWCNIPNVVNTPPTDCDQCAAMTARPCQ
jgi:hypothetical protein